MTDKIGLTDLYNRFHDPEEKSPNILRLRELHTAMDRAVLNAYGWHDIPTACEFLLDYEEEDESPEPGKKASKKKKPWRYRWPDDIRDEVLARLLALNAERHAEEVALGIAPGMKQVKKVAKKKVAKAKKTKSAKQEDHPELFPTLSPAAGERTIPTSPRIREGDPNIYATLLVAALLHEAKTPLPWHRLRNAYILATAPKLMLGYALPDEKARVEEWKQSWNQIAGPEHLLPAIMNLGGRNLAAETTASGEPIFALMDGSLHNPEEHVCYDAWLALKISEPFALEMMPDVGGFDMGQVESKVYEFV